MIQFFYKKTKGLRFIFGKKMHNLIIDYKEVKQVRSPPLPQWRERCAHGPHDMPWIYQTRVNTFTSYLLCFFLNKISY